MKLLRSIFLPVRGCHAQSGHYRQLWQRHFYEGLKGVVQTLYTPQEVDFDWAPRRPIVDEGMLATQRSKTRERLWEPIRLIHRRHGLDEVISDCFGGDVEAELVRETIRLGIPWINLCCDSTRRFSEVEDLARVLRECLAMLGLNQGRDEQGRLASYLEFRDVEFPGYGCCYITQPNQDIARVFAGGEEVLTYRNLWEVARQARRLQHEPRQAMQIGQTGRRRVLARRTWAARLSQLAASL